jgi:hypothetical protein
MTWFSGSGQLSEYGRLATYQANFSDEGRRPALAGAKTRAACFRNSAAGCRAAGAAFVADLFGLEQAAQTYEHFLIELVFYKREHVVLFLFDVVFHVLHQHLQLRLELRIVSAHAGHFRKKRFDLAVFLQPFADDLLQFFVAVVEHVRVKNLFFDMRVQVKLFLDPCKDVFVVAVFVRPDPREERSDRVVVGLQQIESIFGRGREDPRDGIDDL